MWGCDASTRSEVTATMKWMHASITTQSPLPGVWWDHWRSTLPGHFRCTVSTVLITKSPPSYTRYKMNTCRHPAFLFADSGDFRGFRVTQQLSLLGAFPEHWTPFLRWYLDSPIPENEPRLVSKTNELPDSIFAPRKQRKHSLCTCQVAGREQRTTLQVPTDQLV